MTQPQADAVIRTERLLLRPGEACDARRLAELINDPAVTRMLSRVPYPYEVQDAQAFLAGVFDVPDMPVWNFLIDLAPFGLIGGISLRYAEDPWPELGYWLGRAFWAQGFATEAAQALTGWAASKAGLGAIGSGHFADNPASGRVLEKAGFLYTGEIRSRFSTARGQAVPTRMMMRLS